MVDFNHNGNGKPAEEPGGKGEGSYLSPTQENKLIRMALNPRRRFKLTREVKQEMIDASRRNLREQDGRVVNGAVANLIKMEALNQRDEHKAIDQEQPDAGVTNQQINIYLPSNGREQGNGYLTNGHGANGKH